MQHQNQNQYQIHRMPEQQQKFGLSEVVLPALMAVGSSVASGVGAAGAAIGSGVGAAGTALGGIGDAIGAGWTASGLTGALSGGLTAAGIPAGIANFAAPILGKTALGAGLGALTGNAGTGAELGAGLGLAGQLGGGALNAAAGQSVVPSVVGPTQSVMDDGSVVTSPGTGAISPAAGALAQSGANPLAQSAAALAGKGGGSSDLTSTLAMLAALSRNANRPSTTAPAAATANMPWNPSGYINRTPVQGYTPATGNFYTYGSSPEPQFYSGNQLNLGPGLAHGGVLSRAMAAGHYADGGALNQSRELSTGQGDHYVEGDDPGQSDLRPANLSDGEFIMDATTTSKLGAGNSNAGARGMQAIRHAINQDTKSNGIVMKKPKSPLHYVEVGKRAVRAA